MLSYKEVPLVTSAFLWIKYIAGKLYYSIALLASGFFWIVLEYATYGKYFCSHSLYCILTKNWKTWSVSGGISAADRMWTDEIDSSWFKFQKKIFFVIYPFSSCTIDFEICLYARHFDTSHCPHILKLILKELKEEKAIFSFFKLESSLSVYMRSVVLIPLNMCFVGSVWALPERVLQGER